MARKLLIAGLMIATVVGLEQDAEGRFGFDPLEILRRLLSREK